MTQFKYINSGVQSIEVKYSRDEKKAPQNKKRTCKYMRYAYITPKLD